MACESEATRLRAAAPSATTAGGFPRPVKMTFDQYAFNYPGFLPTTT